MMFGKLFGHRHKWARLGLTFRKCKVATCGQVQIFELYPDGTQGWVNTDIDANLISKYLWNREVQRNIENLCVWCGAPAETLSFFDVPVCCIHKRVVIKE